MTELLNPLQQALAKMNPAAAMPARGVGSPKNLPANDSAQLPLWPDAVRGVPNSILRSALFGAIKKGRRAFLQREQLAALEGVTVLFSGPRLDQADLDVWEQCLHLAKSEGLGSRIQFSACGFLREINRATGGRNVDWLKGAFARLSSSVVEIKDGKRAYFGAMISEGCRNDETGHYALEINTSIVRLYGVDGWSQIEWHQRQALKGQPLAQWLHGFYSSHAAPYRLKVETLHRLSGSEAVQLKHFRAELRDALLKITTAIAWHCHIEDSDLVRIDKTPSSSQKRHLKRQRRMV